MTTPLKTAGTQMLALTQAAGLSVTKSSEIDVSSIISVSGGIHFGRRIATAGGAGVNLRLEYSVKASGDGFWFPVGSPFTTQFAATTYTATGGSGNTSGTPTLTFTNTGFVVGDLIHIDDGTSTTSGEFARVQALISTTGLTIEDNLLATHNSKNVSRLAELFPFTIDVTSYKRLRLVVDGSAFTQVFAVEAWINSFDSF